MGLAYRDSDPRYNQHALDTAVRVLPIAMPSDRCSSHDSTHNLKVHGAFRLFAGRWDLSSDRLLARPKGE